MEQHPNVPQSHPLKLKNVVKGVGGPKRASNEVIDEDEELAEYAASCTDAKEGEQVLACKAKFEREKVIAVALGERPTGGYEVEVVSATQISGGVVGLQTVIGYVERGPQGPATQVLTYPHHVVRVKNAAGVIIFRRVPEVTTMAVGEEDPPATTLAVGEEDPRPTTLMYGEEGPPTSWIPIAENPTTLAFPGEEGTTWVWGEEGPPSDPRVEDPFGSGGGGGRGPFGGF